MCKYTFTPGVQVYVRLRVGLKSIKFLEFLVLTVDNITANMHSAKGGRMLKQLKIHNSRFTIVSTKTKALILQNAGKIQKFLYKFTYRAVFVVALFVFSINTAFIGIAPQEAHAAVTHTIKYKKTNTYVPSFTQIDKGWAKDPINDAVRKRYAPYYWSTYRKSGKVYIVKPGDELDQIAKKYKMTLSALLKINSNLKKNPNLIYPSQKIVIRKGVMRTRKVATTPSTLGMYGCGITALSMILCHYDHNKDKTCKTKPNQIAKNPDYFADSWGWDLLYWDKIYKATGKRFEATPVNLTGNAKTIATNEKEAVKKRGDAFKEKKPFMVWFNMTDKKGKYLGWNHYVVITGKDKKGRWMMNDPMQKGNRVFSYGRKNIVQYVFVDKK